MKTGDWYYKSMGKVVGPLSAKVLKAHGADGFIDRDTLVRKGKDGAWVSADKVGGLLDKPATASAIVADLRLRRETVARIKSGGGGNAEMTHREETAAGEPLPLVPLLGCIGGILVIVILVLHTVSDGSPGSSYATSEQPGLVKPTEEALAAHPEFRRIQWDKVESAQPGTRLQTARNTAMNEHDFGILVTLLIVVAVVVGVMRENKKRKGKPETTSERVARRLGENFGTLLRGELPVSVRGTDAEEKSKERGTLRPCPDCGKQISKRAKSCPQCGCPL